MHTYTYTYVHTGCTYVDEHIYTNVSLYTLTYVHVYLQWVLNFPNGCVPVQSQH